MPGTGVYWAGRPALASSAKAERGRGLDHDVAIVRFTEDEYSNWVAQFNSEALERPSGLVFEPQSAAQLTAPNPGGIFPAGSVIPAVGDLVFIEDFGGGETDGLLDLGADLEGDGEGIYGGGKQLQRAQVGPVD